MLKEYPRLRYGEWAGNRKGCKYKPHRCAKEVWDPNGWLSWQCTRRRGHGDENLFCKQHEHTKNGNEQEA